MDIAGTGAVRTPDLEMPLLPLKWAPADVRLRRDPFVRAALPSKGRAQIRVAPADAVVVRAIVTGTDPRALVESGGVSRIITSGGLLLGARVLRIDAAGIHLSNGVTLSLPEVQQ